MSVVDRIEMLQEDKTSLIEFYKEDIHKLEKLLDRNLTEWIK